MPLPILQANREHTADDLIRLFYRTELQWTRHLAEETALDIGTAFTNPTLARVQDANRILDAALPEGVGPEAAIAEVSAHYQQQGTRCFKWVLNPSVPRDTTGPLGEYLLAQGFTLGATDILHLAGQPSGAVREVSGLTIIPARASFRHARLLAAECVRGLNEPEQLVEALMLHLDDPHWDALLALQDGAAVGSVGVLAMGEIGRIENLYVAQASRRRGIGRTLMSRALEICARSLFKHVLLAIAPDNQSAVSLYTSLGFRKVGQFLEHVAPENAAP